MSSISVFKSVYVYGAGDLKTMVSVMSAAEGGGGILYIKVGLVSTRTSLLLPGEW